MTVLFGIVNVFRKRLTTWIVFQQLKIMQLENATLKLVLLQSIFLQTSDKIMLGSIQNANKTCTELVIFRCCIPSKT